MDPLSYTNTQSSPCVAVEGPAVWPLELTHPFPLGFLKTGLGKAALLLCWLCMGPGTESGPSDHLWMVLTDSWASDLLLSDPLVVQPKLHLASPRAVYVFHRCTKWEHTGVNLKKNSYPPRL